MIYRIILLAYDGTVEGRRALLEGAEVAKRFEAEVHLLAVIGQNTGAAMAQGLAAAEPMSQTVFYKSTLQEGVEFLKKQGLGVTGHVVHGDPVTEIVSLAQEIKANLVVVGHRDRSGLSRWWNTPTSMSLLDRLDCSVLIGRHELETALTAEAGKKR